MSEPTLPVETAHTPSRAALRALGWGLVVDVSIAIVMVLYDAFTDIRWTWLYWGTLGLTLTKTLLQTTVTYLVRRFVTPYLANRR